MGRWGYCGKQGGKAYAPQIERRQIQANRNQSDQQVKNATVQTFSIKLDDQDQCEKAFVIAQVIKCQGCQAILTSASTILSEEQYQEARKHPDLNQSQKDMFLKKTTGKIWICEFCCLHNNVPADFQPVKTQKPVFLLKKGQEKKTINGMTEIQDNQRVIIFCIDISGSMDFKPMNCTKSRLQSVKQAISDEIKRMNYQDNRWKVGLVAFGTKVQLIGDGSQFKSQFLEPNVYNSFENIIKEVKDINNFCLPVQVSYKNLKTKVQSLQTYGTTALGPALLSSIQLASKGAIGSKVIICTDGEANVGLRDSQFYDRTSQYAKNQKVMVNILALKGDKCNLKQLSKLSIATGGAILKIDPKALGTQFSKITKDEVLGTQAFMTITMNKIFNFKNVRAQNLSKDKTIIRQQLGNFTADTQLAFEFEVVDFAQAKKNPQVAALFKKSKVPMQMQLTYIGRDGSKFLHVITDYHELTQNEKQLFDDINFCFFSSSVLQRASRLIKDEHFDEAWNIIEGYKTSVKSKFDRQGSGVAKADIKKFNEKIEQLQKILYSRILKKQKKGAKMQQKSQKSIMKQIQNPERKNALMGKQLIDSDTQQQQLVKFMRQKSKSKQKVQEKKQN